MPPLRTMMLIHLLLLLLALHLETASAQVNTATTTASSTSNSVGTVSFSFPSFSLGPLREDGQDPIVPRLSRLQRVGT